MCILNIKMNRLNLPSGANQPTFYESSISKNPTKGFTSTIALRRIVINHMPLLIMILRSDLTYQPIFGLL